MRGRAVKVDLRWPVANAVPGRRVLIALAVLVVAHAVLAWLMRIPAISWGEDDAVYSLLARGLAEGSYREYWIIGEPLHVRYPPGFPALLALSNAAFGERLDAHLALMTLCSAASLLLLFDAARRHVGAEVALFATGILALNPTWLSEAGQIMAEAPFRLLLALTLWSATDREDGGDRPVLAIASAALAAFVRTAGIAVIAALALHWMLQRRWKHVLLLGVAAIPAIGWLGWASLAPDSSEVGAYVPVVAGSESPPQYSMVHRASQSAWAYARRALPTALSFFALKANPIDNVLWAALAAVTIPVGLVALWRRWRFSCLLLASYGTVLIAWPWRDARFASPVSGLILLLIGTGLLILARKLRFRHPVALLAPVAILFLVGAWQAGAPRLRAGLACDRANPAGSAACASEHHRGMSQLAKYVRERTPTDAIVFAPKEGAFFYHAQRRSIRDRRAVRMHPDSFTTHLQRSGVTYAVLSPVGINWIGHNRHLARSCHDFELLQTFGGDVALLRFDVAESAGSNTRACEITAPWKDGPPPHWREQ